MIDIFHFFWLLIIALGLGIICGEIIADLNREKDIKNGKDGGPDGRT